MFKMLFYAAEISYIAWVYVVATVSNAKQLTDKCLSNEMTQFYNDCCFTGYWAWLWPTARGRRGHQYPKARTYTVTYMDRLGGKLRSLFFSLSLTYLRNLVSSLDRCENRFGSLPVFFFLLVGVLQTRENRGLCQASRGCSNWRKPRLQRSREGPNDLSWHIGSLLCPASTQREKQRCKERAHHAGHPALHYGRQDHHVWSGMDWWNWWWRQHCLASGL